MYQPSQFQVNQTWVVFQINAVPIYTEQDGDFNVIVLMDAASCFILSMKMVPVDIAEPSAAEWKELFKQAYSHKQKWPQSMLLPNDQPAELFAKETARHGITLIRVPEEQLQDLIGETREIFNEQFGRNPQD